MAARMTWLLLAIVAALFGLLFAFDGRWNGGDLIAVATFFLSVWAVARSKR